MEYRINAPLTFDLIKNINKLPNNCIICFSNTKNLKSSDFKKIKSSLSVRIIGGLDEKKKHKYNDVNYYNRTLYKPIDVVKILETFELIESRINSSWNDLEKAMYIYKILCEGMEYDYNEVYGYEYKNRNLCGILTCFSVCSGFSMIYKEFMDRLGIECDYQNKKHCHSWNVIKIDGKYYPVDLTFDVTGKSKDRKCKFYYFGNDPLFFDDDSHKATDEMIIPSNTFDINKFLDANAKINNKRIACKDGIIHKNKFDRYITYTINRRKEFNQLFVMYDGKLKTILYNNDSDLDYLLNLDYSKGDVFVLNRNKDDKLSDFSNRIKIATRSDGSQLYVEDTINSNGDKNTFIIVKYDLKKSCFVVSRIISEEKLISKDNDIDKEKYIFDKLLSDSRLSDKINRFGGYVGFVRKEYNKFVRVIDAKYEEYISGLKRF